LVLLVTGIGCAPTDDPDTLARCRQDAGMWTHYHAANMDGPRARVLYDVHQCERGNYHPAVEDLEAMLSKRAQIRQ
jgi:hypothetical protein